jgi:hypothetical protein
MPIIYTYPTATPTSEDLLLISDVSETNPTKATRKCTVGSLVALVGALTNTTYTLDVPVATTDLTLTGSDLSTSAVTISSGIGISVLRTSATELTIYNTQLNTNTLYDLSSAQNVNDSDIMLVGSDLTTDIVKLIAGTNITLTDTGSNITIDAAGGGGGGGTLQQTLDLGATASSSGGSFLDQVSIETENTPGTYLSTWMNDPLNAELVWRLERTTGGDEAYINIQNDLGGGQPALSLYAGETGVAQVECQIDLQAASGEITLQASNNAISTESAIQNMADGTLSLTSNDNSAQITNQVYLSASGQEAVIRSADDNAMTSSEIKLNAIGEIVIHGDEVDNASGTSNGDVLSATNADGSSHWRSIASADGSVNITINTDDIDLSAGGGGGVTEFSDTFEPALCDPVSSPTSDLANISYVHRDGRYYSINNMVYIDWYMVFTSDDGGGLVHSGPLGLGFYDSGGTGDIQPLFNLPTSFSAELSNLNMTSTNNAGITVTECTAWEDAPLSVRFAEEWKSAVHGGRLSRDQAGYISFYNWGYQGPGTATDQPLQTIFNPGKWWDVVELQRWFVLSGSMSCIMVPS